MTKKVMLIVRDGWGYSKKKEGNCIRLANLKNEQYYMANYPWSVLKTSGNDVGIPKGFMGGSEVGHLTIGAGRVVWQPLEMINRSIKDRTFEKNIVINNAIEHAKKNESNLHLFGLFSDMGVHGTINHIWPILRLAKKKGLSEVFLHCVLDGRDCPERSAAGYIKKFQREADKIGIGKIASMIGRFYALDRDTNWDRTKIAYELLTEGKGVHVIMDTAIALLSNAYKNVKSDYYVKPIVMCDWKGNPLALLKDGDAFIDWNFRSDRERQITAAIALNSFSKFRRKKLPKNLYFGCMSEYNEEFNLPVAFPQEVIKDNLGKTISNAGLKQLRIAETEKYAHVTFFFNSQSEKPYKGEERILVPSPKVPSYAMKPEMSAGELTDKAIAEIKKDKFDFIMMNFANGDLVGHSGDIKAGIKACKVVDKCIARIVKDATEHGYTIMLTGDHGNVENMLYPDGSPRVAHGLNPVAFILISNEKEYQKVKLYNGGLSDIAPTILRIMGIKKPGKMAGKCLFTVKK